MVSAVSLIGAAFAVGGSYFAVDTLRDVLIAKTITMPYATRMAIASAAALGGLLVISNMAAQDARKQTKQNLGKQLMGAEDDDPNYMVRRDLHSLNESSVKMNVLLDEFPEVDLMPWWKSKLSVAANTTDNLADTLGHYISSPEDFDAEGYDHRKDGSWSRMVADTPTDTVMHQVDIFHDSFITDVDEAHRAAQRWLRKNENDRFDQIHYIIDMIDTGKWGMEYIALDTMDAEELTFHDWSDQEMMTHGKDDSFEDWVEHEIDSHGNLTLRDWADDEEESHIRRYGAETAYSMIEHQDDTCLKQIADSLRDKYGLGPINGFFEWDSDSDGNLTLGIYDDDNNRLDKIVYDRKALAKALKQVGYRNPESWGAEGTKVRRHSLDRFTKQRKPSGDSFRRKGRRSALRSMMAADSDDDDDDSSLVPDSEPSRGAPDLWFAEGNSRRFTPQEALEYLRSGDNCVWLIDYADENYGDDERPHYDYPIEDPDELSAMIEDGVFDDHEQFGEIIIANDTSYALGMWDDEPGGIHPSFAESPDWMKGMDEEEYAAWADAWNSRSRGPFTDKDAEVFEAFSLSDRPVSVKFGPGTSGNAKMKATFTDASGDTKTTQFGYKGMSDFTKHKDEGRRDSYLARHGSKGQNQNWKDPTTAGALSRYVLWEKTSLPAAKSAFKKRFNLRAEETHARYSVADLGYQESIFLTDPGRRAVWDYETDYSVEDAE